MPSRLDEQQIGLPQLQNEHVIERRDITNLTFECKTRPGEFIGNEPDLKIAEGPPRRDPVKAKRSAECLK